MVAPHKVKSMTELDLLCKRVDQVDKSYRMVKRQFDFHGQQMDTYTLQEQEESIEDAKSQLQEINKDLLSVEVRKDWKKGELL